MSNIFCSEYIVGGILHTALNILILVYFFPQVPFGYPQKLLYLVPIYV